MSSLRSSRPTWSRSSRMARYDEIMAMIATSHRNSPVRARRLFLSCFLSARSFTSRARLSGLYRRLCTWRPLMSNSLGKAKPRTDLDEKALAEGYVRRHIPVFDLFVLCVEYALGPHYNQQRRNRDRSRQHTAQAPRRCFHSDHCMACACAHINLTQPA